MKKKTLTTVLLVLLPFLLTACTLQDIPVIGKLFERVSPEQTGPLTLTVWGLWENPEVMDTLIAKYQESHPDVTINYEDRSVLALGDYKQSVISRVDQEGGPDIIRMHNSWVLRLKDKLAPMPASLMDTNTYSQNFYPVATEESVSDGNIYAVPLQYDGLVLVYNIDHFNEVGQKEPPTAWEEFRRLALELTIRGDGGKLVRSGAAIGNADNIDFFSDILGLMFSQAGVKSASNYNSKPAQDALSFYTNFVREDRVWDAGMPEASAAFAQEKVSMIFIPSWNLLDILKARPDLNIGVAPVPQARPEEPVTWATYWVETVPAVSTKKTAAWEFIRFLAEEEQQLMMYNESSKYREYGSPYSLVSLSAQLANNQYLSPILDIAPFATSNIIAARSGNDPHTEALKNAVNGVLNGGSPAQVLSQARDVIVSTL